MSLPSADHAGKFSSCPLPKQDSKVTEPPGLPQRQVLLYACALFKRSSLIISLVVLLFLFLSAPISFQALLVATYSSS